MDQEKLMESSAHNIVFFDGHCGLCSEFVDFVLKVDKKALFKFSPLQSDFARSHLPHELTQQLSTVVIISQGKTFTKAPALLALFKVIGGPWKILALFSLLPAGFLNFFYDLMARYRYILRPPRQTCRLPSPQERERFLL